MGAREQAASIKLACKWKKMLKYHIYLKRPAVINKCPVSQLLFKFIIDEMLEAAQESLQSVDIELVGCVI